MNLHHAMERQGRWLFRWRSVPPVIALVLILTRLRHYHYLDDRESHDNVWQLACALVAVAGIVVRAHVVGHAPKDTSGRNAREQRAQVLNTTGLYSVVRHPLYVGNFLIFAGTVAFLHDAWPAAVCVLGFCLYHERIIMAEEAFLEERFGPTYSEWARVTPAIVPTATNWRPPTLPFSLRNVLRREYNNAFSAVAAMFILDTASDSAASHHLEFGHVWTPTFVAFAVAWLLLRTLKRRTSILRVAGR